VKCPPGGSQWVVPWLESRQKRAMQKDLGQLDANPSLLMVLQDAVAMWKRSGGLRGYAP